MSKGSRAIERIQNGLNATVQKIQPEMLENFQEQGVTPTQLFVLSFLKKNGSCKISQLVELMEVKPSAVTFMIDRLEQNGMVIRQHDTKDRRVVNISLTDLGEEKFQKVLEGRKKIVERYLAVLSEEELLNMADIVEKLALTEPVVKETAECTVKGE
ncbi:MarR family winged helix-turn-helix transcriptional regulator [Metabacillus sp. RGM 3146]|uniref:MarR family winged helix-turn-helix transcriptional regulator n=1 Tax=Metabacillus sp. RGM 3146 TaxID=3401092 RepID=UPI003B9A46F6